MYCFSFQATNTGDTSVEVVCLRVNVCGVRVKNNRVFFYNIINFNRLHFHLHFLVFFVFIFFSRGGASSGLAVAGSGSSSPPLEMPSEASEKSYFCPESEIFFFPNMENTCFDHFRAR